MPTTEVRVFRDDEGNVPAQVWLARLRRRQPKAYAKCLARILELSEKGYEMRRPQSDYLRDSIYELRASCSGVNYRLLYFFSGKNIVVVSHGITKEVKVPPAEIDLAISRKKLVQKSPDRYTADFELEE
jgi:hypothetical protein